MQREARRITLLAAAMLLTAALLAACSAPSAPLPSSSNGGGGINVFRTPNPNAASPTPTFPPFTVGAWPSDYSPANNEHMTIYVLCKSQPANMSGPSQPVTNVPVDVYIGAPLNQDISQAANPKPVTDSSGLAAVQFDLNDPQSGTPVPVTITVTLGGSTYHAETFFTPNPTAAPTATPNPDATPSGTATGTPSGTAGP
jgi:hypothetical protein